jgi:phosphonate transport system substrate-binding protein
VSPATPRELRLLTYLAPGLPLELFETVRRLFQATLALTVRLRCETAVSAPRPDEPDPFRADEADVGFLCSPGYFWLSELEPPAVELLPAAFEFDDPRSQGRPVYFADVVVRQSRPARSLHELRGSRWAFNDPCSLSGYFSMLQALIGMGADERFFAAAIASGSHAAALRDVREGRADCAAIDSNVLARELREHPELRRELRVLESFGPFPVQPIVVRAGLPRELKDELADALLRMHATERWRRALQRCGVRRLVAVDERNYAAERRLLADCQARSWSPAAEIVT